MWLEKIRKPFLIALAISLLCYTIWDQHQKDSQKNLLEGVIQIADISLPVEIRNTSRGRAQGLSGRTSLEPGTGMVFLFSRPSFQHFWMKDMNFPLDMIWIRGDRVIGIEADVPHPAAYNGEIKRVLSPEPADTVLEINAGEAADLGIQVGDRVELKRR